MAQPATAFPQRVRPKPDDPRWSFLELDDRSVNAFVTFYEGVVHSGYFWVDVPSGGWDDYERAEQQRPVEHERLMQELFSAPAFENQAIRIELVRDPRSGLEQISFEVRSL